MLRNEPLEVRLAHIEARQAKDIATGGDHRGEHRGDESRPAALLLSGLLWRGADTYQHCRVAKGLLADFCKLQTRCACLRRRRHNRGRAYSLEPQGRKTAVHSARFNRYSTGLPMAVLYRKFPCGVVVFLCEGRARPHNPSHCPW